MLFCVDSVVGMASCVVYFPVSVGMASCVRNELQWVCKTRSSMFKNCYSSKIHISLKYMPHFE